MSANSPQYNIFYDSAGIDQAVAQARHRELVGGLWDEVGKLQFDFLVARGLKPESRLIDVGCGSLRGGVHFVEFLDSAKYFGTDIRQSLLDAGFEIELREKGLQEKLPREHLVCDDKFNFSQFAPTEFDFALAQSVFTHLPANHLQLCLARLAPHMAAGGVFYATFFIVPDAHPFGEPYDHPGGGHTFDDRDPYHYRAWQIRDFCRELPWSVDLIGPWGHPRGQQMVCFRVSSVGGAAEGDASRMRALNASEARTLPAGADHYRAYVGPPDRFDFMSASQFALLFALGLREHHRVLDFGCGSLRLGRLLIPYLLPKSYFGIDPNRWLIEDAFARELGEDAVRIKQPTFSYNDDFRCDVFGVKFAYVVAQSIMTHCGVDLTQSLLNAMSAALTEDGKIIFSMLDRQDDEGMPDERGWIYPACVSYGISAVTKLCAQAGLVCRRIPWYHPGAVWYVAAKETQYLPPEETLPLLRGAVLYDPQFRASLSF